MKELSIKMNGYQRPVITLYGNNAIIDTGAVIPMVSLHPELLKLAWNAELLSSNIQIGGIGGKATGNIYTLHDFYIDELKFSSLDVFVPDIPDTKYTYLLSITMFYGMNMSFNMIDPNDQSFLLNIPYNIPLTREFKIKELQGQLYVQVDGILVQDAWIPSIDIINYTQEINDMEIDIER